MKDPHHHHHHHHVHGQHQDAAGALVLDWTGMPGPQLAKPAPPGPAQTYHCLHLELRSWLSSGGASFAQGLEGAMSCSP